MDKETTEPEVEDDFDIDELLNEDEDNPIEVTEESPLKESHTKPMKKGKGRPKGSSKKKETEKVPEEIAEANKDLSMMEWQIYSQPAYEGYQNIKTGEMIDEKEALRRALCYAQEAARNSR